MKASNIKIFVIGQIFVYSSCFSSYLFLRFFIGVPTFLEVLPNIILNNFFLTTFFILMNNAIFRKITFEQVEKLFLAMSMKMKLVYLFFLCWIVVSLSLTSILDPFNTSALIGLFSGIIHWYVLVLNRDEKAEIDHG